MFENHSHSQSFLLPDFVSRYKELGGGGRTVLLFPSSVLVFVLGKCTCAGIRHHTLTLILVSLPGSWGKKAILQDIFELFL